jgi:hypothetical protein
MTKPRLALAGDLTLTDQVIEGIRRDGAARWFVRVAPLLADVDALVCNLEAPAVDGGKAREGKLVLASGSSALEALPVLKVRAVSLANNHVTDWGLEGAIDTARRLSDRGIASTGLTVDGPGAAPARLELRGWSVGLLAYADPSCGVVGPHGASEGVQLLQLEAAVDDVRRLAGMVDAVLVSIHGGDEQVPYPEPHLLRATRSLAEAGAAVVFAHHPHCIRGIERHGRALIAHGLGNFISPDHLASKDARQVFIPRFKANRIGAVLVVEPAGRGEVSVVDVRFTETDRGGRTRPLPRTRARAWKRQLQRLAEPLERPDYVSFQAVARVQALRLYKLKLGFARAVRQGPRWSQFTTGWRLFMGERS